MSEHEPGPEVDLGKHHDPKFEVGTEEHHVEVSLDELPEIPHPPHRASAGELAFGDEQPSLLEAMGGPVGMVESGVPPIAFLIASTAGSEVKEAAIIAVALAVVMALVRLVRREPARFALFGILGVAIAAGIATVTGEAKNFFLPSFAVNVGYGTLALGSVLLHRPFVGYIAENLSEETDDGWREDPVKLRRYKLASLLWVGIFTIRLAIQIPIYLMDDDVVILGTVKLIMGYPLFGVGVWLTWLLVRKKALESAGAGTSARAAGDVATDAAPAQSAAAPVEPGASQ